MYSKRRKCAIFKAHLDGLLKPYKSSEKVRLGIISGVGSLQKWFNHLNLKNFAKIGMGTNIVYQNDNIIALSGRYFSPTDLRLGQFDPYNCVSTGWL